VTVGGKSVGISTGSAALSAIDTGTTLIGGPSDDVAAIWAAVPGSAQSRTNQGFFTYREYDSHHAPAFRSKNLNCIACATKLEISLSFGGKSWPINPVDMNLGPISRGSSQCTGAIFDLSQGSSIGSGSGNPGWVVGDTFLVRSSFRGIVLSSTDTLPCRRRKTSTPFSVLPLPPSDLPSSPLQPADQVRDHRHLSAAYHSRLRSLLLLLCLSQVRPLERWEVLQAHPVRCVFLYCLFPRIVLNAEI